MSSIDEVQNALDTFVLSTFDAVHTHEVAAENEDVIGLLSSKCDAVSSGYLALLRSINHLTGITRCKDDQESELLEISNKYKLVKGDVEELSSKLTAYYSELEKELEVCKPFL